MYASETSSRERERKMASSLTIFVFSLLSLLFIKAQTRVPPSEQFRIVHGGEFIEYRPIEYGADVQDYKVFNDLFQLSIYNTTPNAFILALRMGEPRQMSTLRWIWEANRGNPVRLNATLTFGADGNLVLADADGRVAWQTGTANKGVVGIKVKDNGNLILHDSKGNPIWQSFDFPTDTLMIGQSLKSGGRTKLVSRMSDEIAADGPYSLVMEPKRLAIYYTSPDTKKPILYYAHDFSKDVVGTGDLESLTFGANFFDDEEATYLELRGQVTGSEYGVFNYFARPKYNATLSLLRLSPDGNLRIYTYNTKVATQAWEVIYTLFYKQDEYTSFGRATDEDATVCQLPEHCGQFGLCKNSQCVACPTEKGLTGWDEISCRPPRLTSCDPKKFHYYKLDGVDHFMTRYTRGSDLKEDECGGKCTKDCKCLGYFVNRKSVKCWLAYELKTLTKVDDGSRVGYIKAPSNGNESRRTGRI